MVGHPQNMHAYPTSGILDPAITRFIPILFLLLLTINMSLSAQGLEPKKRLPKADHTLESKLMDREYQLYVSLPSTYDAIDHNRYPVLYVLDGQYMFSTIDGTRFNLDFENRIEDVIIVGVGSGTDLESWQSNRTYEFTYSQDTTVKRFASGGAEIFLSCFKREIMPFVDNHNKTNADNGILGHSLGGLFVMYCFLKVPKSFGLYAMSSPSLMWKNNEILNQAKMVLPENKIGKNPYTTVFVSFGGRGP